MFSKELPAGAVDNASRPIDRAFASAARPGNPGAAIGQMPRLRRDRIANHRRVAVAAASGPLAESLGRGSAATELRRRSSFVSKARSIPADTIVMPWFVVSIRSGVRHRSRRAKARADANSSSACGQRPCWCCHTVAVAIRLSRCVATRATKTSSSIQDLGGRIAQCSSGAISTRNTIASWWRPHQDGWTAGRRRLGNRGMPGDTPVAAERSTGIGSGL